MGKWLARVELEGALEFDQQQEVVAGWVTAARFLGDKQLAELHLTVAAPTAGKALAEVGQKLDQMDALRRFIDDGLLVERRVTLETEEAVAAELPFLTTTAIASRYRLSAARIRQIRDERDDFPQPLKIPGLTDRVYRAVDVDEFFQRYDPKANLGRPRKAASE